MARKLRYNDEEGGMVKAQLMKIESYAAKLNDMIHPDDEIEGWVQAKLAVVAAYMGDVKHYLDYEIKQAFGNGGGVGSKPRYWEVEFTWEGEEEGDGRKVNVMADSVAEAEQKVIDKFGVYYKGLKVVEVEEDKEMTWDEYAATKGVKEMADGGVLEELEEYHIKNGPYISASELEYYLRDMNAKYKYKDGSDYGIAVLANQLGYTWDEDADQFYKKMAKGGGVEEEKIWKIIYKDCAACVQKSILVEGYSSIIETNNWRRQNPTKEFIQIQLYGNKYSKGGEKIMADGGDIREKIAKMNILLNTKSGQVYIGGIKPKNRLFKDENGYFLIVGYGKFMNKKYFISLEFI